MGGLTVSLIQFTDSCRVLCRRNFHYWFRRSPQYATAVQCSQISDSASQANSDEAYDDMETARKGYFVLSPYNKCFRLRPPPFLSLYISSASFHKRFPNPSQPKPPKLMTIQAFSSVDSDGRSAHQHQGCGFYKDILVDTACYSGLAWECGRLAVGSDRASYLPGFDSDKATPRTHVQRGSQR
ncbi:hypothetical protein ARMGADRAFT_1087802 [Armillaria gallica]|uniref:Uncharacterized protein n=1 Tax=Armillaria gallica TaxID=47427 RepID=A0A2H3CUL0_ARMGA|nr:hypothetical protein ARMGADRAFT_1087802 [Armillaria gallica]